MTAWAYDGACLYYTRTQPELNESISFFKKVSPFIFLKTIFILATGLWYYLTFMKCVDKQQEQQQQRDLEDNQQEEIERKEEPLTLFTFPLSRYKFKWVYLTLSVILTAYFYSTGHSSVTDDTPFPYINLMLLINNFQSLFFLAKNTATTFDGVAVNLWHMPSSYLITSFFITVMPLNTLFQFLVLVLWGDNHSGWMTSPTMAGMSWNIYLVETMIGSQIDTAIRSGMLYWPDFNDDDLIKRGYETIA